MSIQAIDHLYLETQHYVQRQKIWAETRVTDPDGHTHAPAEVT